MEKLKLNIEKLKEKVGLKGAWMYEVEKEIDKVKQGEVLALKQNKKKFLVIRIK